MSRTVSKICRIIHNCLWLYILSYFLGAVLSSKESCPGPVAFLPMMIISLYSFIVYNKAKNLFLYILFQIPAVLACFMAGDYFGAKAAYILTLAVMLFCQVMEKRSPLFGPLLPRIQMIFFFASAYFLALYFDRQQFMNICVLALMAEIILFLVYENNEGMNGFLNVRQNIRCMPYRQIRLSNGLFLVCVIAIFMVVFLLSLFFMDNSPLTAFAAWFFYLLKSLIRRMLESEPPIEDEVGIQELPDSFEEIGGNETMPETLPQQTVESPIWGILAAVILAIIAIILIMSLIRLIIKIIIAFSKKEAKIIEKQDNTEDEITDIRENNRSTLSVRHSKATGIRKQYKREIKRARRQNRIHTPVNPAHTPSQIEEESMAYGVSEEEKEAFESLHDSYEKERYGSQD